MTATTPRLPPELERGIFELAADTYPTTIPTLLQVAQRVRIWVEPLLYRVLRLDILSPHLAVKLLQTIKAKPPQFAASSVQHVLLLHSSFGDRFNSDVESLLESCPSIINLAFIGGSAHISILPLLGNMHVQRLTVRLGDLFSDDRDPDAIDLGHPMFGSMTHLDLLDDLRGWMQRFSTLPALTHLAFTGPHLENLPIMQGILEASPRIQVLLLSFFFGEEDDARLVAARIKFVDARVVVGLYGDYRTDWERGARSGDDQWIRAEKFVARKRRGEITEDCYFMDEDLVPDDDDN
ncbi:hypothetical protein B0H17DRAFT_1196611 [Mycena rosella]|uniref:Uncharacterized protein n=1 Tax=Mycena rosella TaxID=1033263 RepID=A0AAD7DTJ6_MYCRO|nr:hypothetical protein B0H17DRAFT_1196611 [Mycena rosella]